MDSREKYLELLKKNFSTKEAVAAEIVNLKAILSLPKGTEHFVSDIHGEYEAFCHLLNTCSGVIREKVDLLYKGKLSDKKCAMIASLISYPKETIELRKIKDENIDIWYKDMIKKLVHILLRVSSKYTRSKVRKAVNKEFSYIINELINAKREGFDYESFCNGVYDNIIELQRAPDFIEALAKAIKRLAVDNLHIIGDIFDRGEHPDYIMDLLLEYDNVDVQWGNHDIQWIGAFFGNVACILNILYIAFKCGNVEAIEDGYGISLRRLFEYARKNYLYDARFAPNNKNLTEREKRDFAKMRKAVFFLMLKAEREIILRNPSYDMQDRLILDNIDRVSGTYTAPDGSVFFDEDFKMPYVDKELTVTEQEVLEHLKRSFSNSEKLKKHVDFLMKHGGLYKVVNGNLLYHGCIPLNEDGSYAEQELSCGVFKGKEYFDACERIVRRAYSNHFAGKESLYDLDFIWYLWCGKRSPLFGRDKIATFERVYLPGEYGVEVKNPCYKYTQDKEVCERILRDFGVTGDNTHIINGHVPVKSKDGESPIKADGKLLVIDGGFCRAYQKTTGIAGYTLIYNSYGLRMSAHEPFGTKEEAVKKCKDIHSLVTVFEHTSRRLTIADTDQGAEIKSYVDDLLELLDSGLM